ncbi:signal recognition particle subunit srp68 [Homalodisca vitripennis]|nr:signal recognition particle subunit srp68 [Homalodisca vitripennis]
MRRWREAGSMYQRAESYARAAQTSVAEMHTALTQLIEEVDGARYSSLAHAVLEDDSSEQPAQAATSKAKKKIPLVDRLEEYREDPALTTKQPNVIKLPPDMQPVPCKPLFFDLALNLVKYPSLEDKLDTTGKKANPAGLTSFVKGLWGWGNK